MRELQPIEHVIVNSQDQLKPSALLHRLQLQRRVICLEVRHAWFWTSRKWWPARTMRQINYVNCVALNLPLVSAMTHNHNECATSTGSNRGNINETETARQMQRPLCAVKDIRKLFSKREATWSLKNSEIFLSQQWSKAGSIKPTGMHREQFRWRCQGHASSRQRIFAVLSKTCTNSFANKCQHGASTSPK